jgi:hypothetical protein
MSLYAFANGDPVNQFDPDGRFGKDLNGNPYPFTPGWTGDYIGKDGYARSVGPEGSTVVSDPITGKIIGLENPPPGIQPLLFWWEGTPLEAVYLTKAAVSLASGSINYVRSSLSQLDASLSIRLPLSFESFTPLSQAQLNMTNNALNGAAFSDLVYSQAAARNAAALREVSVSPYLDSGVIADFRIRLDTIAISDTSAAARTSQLIEAKASATAPLTARQTQGFPLFERNGGVVRGDAGGTLLPAGTQLPPSSIYIQRPPGS